MPDKAYENRMRRMAARQGLRLQKCRRRDPWAVGYGTYRIVNERTEKVVYGSADAYGLSLHDVERRLKADR